MGEIWRPIEGYEGIHLVSNLGRVKSVDREIMEKTGIRRPIKGRILKPYIDKVGYKTCRLYKKGKYYQYELAEKFDIDPSQISRIINGTAWGWLKTDSQKEANIQ